MGRRNVTLFLDGGTLVAAYEKAGETTNVSLGFESGGDMQIQAKAVADALGVEKADFVICPGGLLKPLAPGTYEICESASADLSADRYGYHPYNRLALLCRDLARLLCAVALMHNPLSSDSMLPLDRFSSMARVKKQSRYYACEHDALIWQTARKSGRRYDEMRAIVAIVDNTVSIGAHDRCRCLDANDVFGAEGPMGFTSSGDLPVAKLAALFMKGKADLAQMRDRLMNRSGVLAYLGTDSPEELDDMVGSGDEQAILIADALAFQTAKWIGSGALLLKGEVDAIILSGKGVRSEAFAGRIKKLAGPIAPIVLEEKPDLAGYLGYVAGAAGTPVFPVRRY